jgi:hypothetical protein
VNGGLLVGYPRGPSHLGRLPRGESGPGESPSRGIRISGDEDVGLYRVRPEIQKYSIIQLVLIWQVLYVYVRIRTHVQVRKLSYPLLFSLFFSHHPLPSFMSREFQQTKQTWKLSVLLLELLGISYVGFRIPSDTMGSPERPVDTFVSVGGVT